MTESFFLCGDVMLGRGIGQTCRIRAFRFWGSSMSALPEHMSG